MTTPPARTGPRRPHRPGERGETAATVRWERVTYWPLTVLALAFLLAYTLQVIGDLTGVWSTVCGVIVGASWAAFVVDYLARLTMSRPRGRWFRHHLFDLAVALLPALRPARLLDALDRAVSSRQTPGGALRGRLLVYGVGVALLLVWQASLTVLQFERHASGATITTFGDAVWWAFCTLTTVGYGDYTPVTVPGRVTAVLLMISGVVLLGLVTATFASWVSERITRGHEEVRPATRADVDRILGAIGSGRPAQPDAGDPPTRG